MCHLELLCKEKSKLSAVAKINKDRLILFTDTQSLFYLCGWQQIWNYCHLSPHKLWWLWHGFEIQTFLEELGMGLTWHTLFKPLSNVLLSKPTFWPTSKSHNSPDDISWKLLRRAVVANTLKNDTPCSIEKLSGSDASNLQTTMTSQTLTRNSFSA